MGRVSGSHLFGSRSLARVSVILGFIPLIPYISYCVNIFVCFFCFMVVFVIHANRKSKNNLCCQ